MKFSNSGKNPARKQHIARRMAALGVPDFETLADCTERQHRMVSRFRRRGVPPETVEGLMGCSPNVCGMFECRDGCHFAARRWRYETVSQAVEAFARREGPIWFVTVVHPAWSWPSTEPYDPDRIRQAHDWLAVRLEWLEQPDLLAVGSWEFCLNVELDGTRAWSGHLHFISAGASYDALDQALTISRAASAAPRSKPVVIKPAGESLGRRTAYSLKLYAEQRVAYQDATDRFNRRHLPLAVPDQYYFDQALCSLNIGARAFWFDAWPYVPDVIQLQAL